MGVDIPDDLKMKGATEIDIVYTALDEIMTTAVEDNWNYNIKNPNLNFRDACLVNAITKISRHYQEVGFTV